MSVNLYVTNIYQGLDWGYIDHTLTVDNGWATLEKTQKGVYSTQIGSC